MPSSQPCARPAGVVLHRTPSTRTQRLWASLAAAAAATVILVATPAANAAFPSSTGLPGGCEASGDRVSCSYGPGGERTFIVPAGVSLLDAVVAGSKGKGRGYSFTQPGWFIEGSGGGRGALVTGSLSVVPGTTLFLNVRGQGAGSRGGGGAADIRTIAGDLASRVVVAGGGGGIGDGPAYQSETSSNGGDAGADGRDYQGNVGGSIAGRAGTTTAGGAAGTGCGSATPGTLGFGGALGGNSRSIGGDGGDGLYGGGGGQGICDPVASYNAAGGGGGGGSSLVPAGGTSGHHAGANGSIQVSYDRAESTTAVSAPATASYGTPTTLTATVASSAVALDGGLVQFHVDGEPVGSPSAVDPQTGIATLAMVLPGGTHAISGSFGGTATLRRSTSPSDASVEVARAATSTTLVMTGLSASGTATYAAPPTATITVTSSAGPITGGTVDVLDGDVVATTLPIAADGTATWTFRHAVGSHAFTARYTGDGNFLASSDGSASSFTTLHEPVTLTARSIPARTPLAFTWQEQFSLYVDFADPATAPGHGFHGTMTLFLGSEAIATVLVGANGWSRFDAPSLPAGAYDLRLEYSGNHSYAPATLLEPITISNVPTATSLTTSHADATTVDAVTLTATVTSQDQQVPSGTVRFLADGTVTVGSPAPLGADGVATLLTRLPAGTQYVTAEYQGSLVNATSASAGAVTRVGLTSRTITLVAPAVSLFGGNVPITARVNFLASDGGGVVTFFDGATRIGSDRIGPGETTATMTTRGLRLGAHVIHARIGGDSVYVPTSASTSHLVKRLPVTATLVSPVRSIRGQAVTFRARLTAIRGVPTGAVAFFDGPDQIGPARVLVDGAASVTTSAMAVDRHVVTVRYVGRAQYAPARVGRVHYVNRVPTAVILTTRATRDPSVRRISVSLAATFGTRQPTGVVWVLDGDDVLRRIRTGPDGRGSITTGTLRPGLHRLVGEFDGDATFAPGTSPVARITVRA